MGFITRIFGPSKFQTEVQRAISLKWFLVVSNFNSLEYSYRNNIVKKNFSSSILIFDFSLDRLIIKGDLVNEVFDNEEWFQIIKHDFIEGNLVFYLSLLDQQDIIMRCIVERDLFLFEGAKRNWFAKVPTNAFQSITQPYFKI